jgi:hypothetical protein
MKKLIIFLIGIYVVIVMVNGLLTLGPSSDDVITAPKINFANRVPKKKPLGEIVRTNRLVPGMGFEESIFQAGGETICQQQIVNGKVIESDGQVPDGKVKFIDEYRQIYGEESYSRGKKHGLATTHYQDGTLKAESQYILGRLVYNKEFYPDGTVRMEENYEDAIEFPEDPTHETGIGKVYFPDGTLKYEWVFAKNNPTNFKKSYNRDGELTLELYFDKEGYPLKR